MELVKVNAVRRGSSRYFTTYKLSFNKRRHKLLSWQYRDLACHCRICVLLLCKVGHRLLCVCVPSHIAGSILGSTQKGSPLVVTFRASSDHRLNVNLYVEGCEHLTDAHAIVSSEAARIGVVLVLVASGTGLLSLVLANK